MRIKIDEAIKQLKIVGTYFSGSDWKYGWPHKFIIGHDKVYNEDLKLLPDEKVAEWSALTEKFFGVTFFRHEDGRMMWRCEWADVMGPCGYQRAGRVGINGEPNRTDDWNPDFPGRFVN